MTEQPVIVLDANAFMTGAGLLELGSSHKLVTTSEVMQELRDPKTREMLQKFVFPIDQLEPEKASIDAIRDFAKKTGDLSSLSDVDIGLLALAHTLYVRKGLSDQLRQTPPPVRQVEDTENKHYQGQYSEESESYDEPEVESSKQNDTKQAQVQPKQQVKQPDQKASDEQKQAQEQWIVVPVKKRRQKSESDEDMHEDEGWVTPHNFEQKMAEGNTFFKNLKEQSEEQEESQSGIYLMTSDFAMQNVAIQMGISLKSLDGRKVKEVRRFILECYLCWKTYKVEDNKIRLCKQCGYNSLSKIAYSLAPSGMVLHRKKGWKPNQKVLEWKQRKYEEQQRKKKHQHARRKKQASIFEV